MRLQRVRLKDKAGGPSKIKVSDRLKVNISSREPTPEGYLKAVAAITAVGIQEYHCSEFEMEGDYMVPVFRPPETVFHEETIESAKLKPICLTHPPDDVDAATYSRLAVGTIGEAVEPLDEIRLGAHIIVTDSVAVAAVTVEGKDEVSLGYDSHIIKEPGDHNGAPFEYRFIGPMVINHLAIEDAGRCGENVKILDKGWTMKKGDAIKAFKVSGMKDADLAKFLPGKGEDHEVTEAEMATFKVSIGDMDMGGMMGSVASQMAPMLMEKVSKDKNFMKMLADAMAAMMSGVGMEGEAPMDGEDPMMDEMEDPMMDAETKPEGKENDPMNKKMDKAFAQKVINDTVAKKVKSRVAIMDKARVMISDKDLLAKLDAMSNREVIIASLGDSVADATKQETGYLMGVLDAISKDRIEARDSREKFMDSSSQPLGMTSMSALDIRKLK